MAYDEAQVEYYIGIVNRYPKQTLLKHGVIKPRAKESFQLEGSESLTNVEINVLVQLCDEKIREYCTGVTGLVGGHRVNVDPALASIRYQVLKGANGKCALCGITKDDSPIDVDHIKPRSKGGSNDLSNLQALCYRCNRGKGNKDDTDFRDHL